MTKNKSVAPTFFWYDLETSGISPKNARVMQFAGRRTDLDFRPMGEPINRLIKLSDDVLPDPEAVLLTGITPQMTLEEGQSEADFLKFFDKEIATPGTIFVGFNNVRFDDNFIRYQLFRNYYDPYEWQWKDNRGRWDILDVVRMTRALRPDGINWPVSKEGKPTNRLELLTAENNLAHDHAHDALSDVDATIAVAKLISEKQPKIYDYLLQARDKKQVAKLVDDNQPFVYTSGRYSSNFLHTTVVCTLGEDRELPSSRIVYDLRYDPSEFLDMTSDQLVDRFREATNNPEVKQPATKELRLNFCPAVAPMGVLDNESVLRIGLDMDSVVRNFKAIEQSPNFKNNLLKALAEIALDKKSQRKDTIDIDPAAKLYDGFIGDSDKLRLPLLRQTEPSSIIEKATLLEDNRLKDLALGYVARNYPASLDDVNRKKWESFKKTKLFEGGDNSLAVKYFKKLGELANVSKISKNQQFLLEELQLYGQSIMPDDMSDL